MLLQLTYRDLVMILRWLTAIKNAGVQVTLLASMKQAWRLGALVEPQGTPCVERGVSRRVVWGWRPKGVVTPLVVEGGPGLPWRGGCGGGGTGKEGPPQAAVCLRKVTLPQAATSGLQAALCCWKVYVKSERRPDQHSQEGLRVQAGIQRHITSRPL